MICRLKFIFFISAAFFYTSRAFAQFTFKNFLNVSGKKEIPVRCIAQDKNNFLWLGTPEGLIRFNGKRSEIYKGEPAYSGLNVSAILADNTGHIWFGTERGKVYILSSGGKKIDSLNFEGHPPSAKITSLFISESGTIFIGTYGDGIYIKQKNGILHFNNQKGLSDDVVYNLFFYDKKLWCGTDAGISVLSALDDKEPKCTLLSNKEGLPDNIVRNINYAAGNFIISMQDSGICTYNPKTNLFERNPAFANWTYGAVINAYTDADSDFIIATEKKGIITIHKDKIQTQSYDREINLISANAFFKDNSGNFWLASPKGLHLLYKKRYDFINNTSGLKNDKITAVNVSSGTIWLGTETGIETISKNNNSGRILDFLKKLSNATITYIAKNNDGRIWFGTYGNGIIILDPVSGNTEKLNSGNGLSNDNISTIYFEGLSKVFISTLGGGLNAGTLSSQGRIEITRVYTEKDGLGSNYVYASVTDKKGKLFVASDGGGLEIKERDGFKSISTKNKIHSYTVYSLCRDSSGNIWAATSDNGLLKYSASGLQSIGTKEGLRDEQPQQILALGSFVYALHSSGIDKINCVTNSISYYDVSENDLAPNLNAICADNGILYSGTGNGLLEFHYENKYSGSSGPVALISGLQINYKDFSLDSVTEIDPGQNHIAISFEGVWLKSPDKLTFRYKLRNYEDKWNYSYEGKTINYNNLSPGTYAFCVQVKNEEGVWNAERTYQFVVLAPVWKKWWFWVALAFCVFSAIYLFIQYRLRSLQKENIVLEEKVNERTSEIAKQSAIIEEKNKELELLSLVASKTDNVVLILDAKGRLEYVNESFVRLNKITFEELKKKGETIFEISNNPEIHKTVEDAIKNKRSVKYEALNRIDDKTEVWEASTLTPIFNEKGELKKIIIIDSDITESKNQERIIFQKNKDITDSIEYARKIQTAILPSLELIKHYLPQSFILYKTKDIVSGDFYWFSEKEDCCIIAAVDCTGHGVPGAFMSIIGYNILNKIVNEEGITDPGSILQRLNTGVLDALYKNQSGYESVDGMDIAICRIKQNSNTIEYAGAMRPLIIAGPSGLKEIQPDKIPIGTVANEGKEINYTTHNVALASGETAYIFTDGYSDQFGGPKGKKLSSTRFKEFLVKYHHLDMQKQHDVLLEEHFNWKGKQEQVDDILVIGFRIPEA